MATKEEISMVGFEIVAYAGDAQTDLLAALDAAREGDFEKAEQLHKDASDALIGAHDTQTKLLSQEAGVGQSMSRKGNCIDNGATEQVFGHMKDEFFRGRTWPDFESFKADLDAYVAHWNTRRRQVKLKGLTPEEFRNQPLAA